MDVIVRRMVAASPQEVAAVMFDPSHDPEWIGGAKSVEPPSGDPTKVGARVARHGGFLARRFSWTTEVLEYQPHELLHMGFVDGPMKGGEVTYRIDRSREGSVVTIRNTGPGPQIMAWFVKRSVAKDLDRLARLVER